MTISISRSRSMPPVYLLLLCLLFLIGLSINMNVNMDMNMHINMNVPTVATSTVEAARLTSKSKHRGVMPLPSKASSFDFDVDVDVDVDVHSESPVNMNKNKNDNKHRIPQRKKHDDTDKDPNPNADTDTDHESETSDHSAIIISTVDGVIYTLDAYNGKLRGMVQSGGPLVSTSTNSNNSGIGIGSGSVGSDKHQQEIIPGLDGALYHYNPHPNTNTNTNTNSHNELENRLNLLPVTIQDIIEHGPISTCIDIDIDVDVDIEHEQNTNAHAHADTNTREICGMVMGQASSKLIALDTLHGTVEWMHDTSSSSLFNADRNKNYGSSSGSGGSGYGGNRGRGSKQDSNPNTVLLQREDYNVKHIDAETGEEGWRVHLGNIKALDVPKKRRRRRRGQMQVQSNSGNLGAGDMTMSADVDVGTGSDIDNKKGGLFRIQSQTQSGIGSTAGSGLGSGSGSDAHETPSIPDPFLFAPDTVQPFPSVAFGSDGFTLYAYEYGSESEEYSDGDGDVDGDGDDMDTEEGYGGRVLWVKNFESVISSVYGVDGDLNFVNDLEVLDLDMILDANDEDEDSEDEGDGIYDYDEEEYVEYEAGEEDAETALSLHRRPPSISHPLMAVPVANTARTAHRRTMGHGNGDGDGHGSGYGNGNGYGGNGYSHPDEYAIGSGQRSHPQHLLASAEAESEHGHKDERYEYYEDEGEDEGEDGEDPYYDICDNEDYQAFVGQHRSSLFVASTGPALGRGGRGRNYNDNDNDGAGQSSDDVHEHEYEQYDGVKQLPAPMPIPNGNAGESLLPFYQEIIQNYTSRLNMDISHRTEHGLFLTWKMVTLLFACILSGVVGGRYVYLWKKRKWILQSSPALVPSNSNPDMDLGLHLHSTPRLTPNAFTTLGGADVDAVPLLNLERAHTIDSPKMKAGLSNSSSKNVIHKSASLPDLELYSKGGSKDGSGHDQPASHSKMGVLVGKKDDNGPSAVQTTMGGTATRSRSGSGGGSGSGNDTLRPMERYGYSSTEGVSSIDGIPLVRYSRYKSEFGELSALGKGGFGTVFKCRNTLDGREYAVKKVLIKSILDSNGQLPEKFSQRLERVLREVKILALLDHSNIVRYYTAWLEVEAEDHDETDPSPHSVQSESFMSRAMSTDLLAGTSTFGDQSSSPLQSSASISPSRSNHLQYALNQHLNHNSNPLGWNTFSAESADFSESSCESRSLQGYGKFMKQGLSSSSLKNDEDLGFTFDRGSMKGSSRNLLPLSTIQDNKHVDDENESSSSSSSSSSSGSSTDNQNSLHSDSESGWSIGDSNGADATVTNMAGNDDPIIGQTDISHVPQNDVSVKTRTQKHILYIQMQLSQKTLLDYFRAREGNIDIPLSLKIFGHIARGVAHVHSNGLIHRDLKPSNCFMDDSDIVKIGDFGLSRESGAQNEDVDEFEITTTMANTPGLGHDEDNTVGVGTSSYASPEQMSGSDYDSSSDVYSLGILLFELCYPMNTGMERIKVFEGIRRRTIYIPSKWHQNVANHFPSIHTLLITMLSHDPKTRPTAAEVTTHIESLLSEYTVHSLDQSLQYEDSIFLRIEAEDNENALARTINVIRGSSPLVHILQYSLKAKDSKKIMEFALSIATPPNDSTKQSEVLETMFATLRSQEEINVVRQINEAAPPPERGIQNRTLSM